MRKAGFVLALLLTGAAAHAQSAQLPPLTNEQFRRIFETFSEPGGAFSSDNFTSNEITIGQLSTDLRVRGRTGGAYIGVGPEQNFTYIAALKPQIAFIVDIRRQAVLQHLMFKAVFELSGNRSEFVSRLFSRPLQRQLAMDVDVDFLFATYRTVNRDTALFLENTRAILNQLAGVRGIPLSSMDSTVLRNVYNAFFSFGPEINYSIRMGALRPPAGNVNFATLASAEDSAGVKRAFLGSDADFQFLRNLHLRNLIIPVVGNFGGTQALRMVGDYLRERNIVLSAYYTSNVEQYLFTPTELWRQYYLNVSRMPLDSMSIFIRPSVFSVGGGITTASSLANGITTANTLPPPVPPPGTSPAPPPMRGIVAGLVADSTARPVSNVIVVLSGTSYAAVTGTDGRFAIRDVPIGIYTLSATRVGFSPVTLPNIRVAAASTTQYNLRLDARGLQLASVVQTRSPLPMRQELAVVQLCPVAPFLAAYNAGKVLVYGDAVTCVR